MSANGRYNGPVGFVEEGLKQVLHNKVIDQTYKIIRLLENEGSSGAWPKSLRHYVNILERDPRSNEALEYLYSACTQPRGLLDIWVEGLTLDDWSEYLNNLKTAIDAQRKQNLRT